MPPQNINNKLINDFFKCAGKDGIRLGATFQKNGDWNHFERGKATKNARTKFQNLLTKYCNQQCPNIPKKSLGTYACKGIKPPPPSSPPLPFRYCCDYQRGSIYVVDCNNVVYSLHCDYCCPTPLESFEVCKYASGSTLCPFPPPFY